MGKHYHVAGGCLYIFTTGGETLLDLKVFPSELNLFEAESSWRISPRLAVVEDVLHQTAERAGIILQLNEYRATVVPVDVLESYFLDGVENTILEVLRAEASEVETAPEIIRGDEGS